MKGEWSDHYTTEAPFGLINSTPEIREYLLLLFAKCTQEVSGVECMESSLAEINIRVVRHFEFSCTCYVTSEVTLHLIIDKQ